MRIVTHFDIDGLISATLAAYKRGYKQVLFTSPEKSAEVIDYGDLVFDLPFSEKAAVWIDHHYSQKERVKHIKFRGLYDPEAPCAAVLVSKYYGVSGDEWKRLIEFAINADTFNLDDEQSFIIASIIGMNPSQQFLEHLFNILLETREISSLFVDKLVIKRIERYKKRYIPETEKIISENLHSYYGNRICVLDATSTRFFANKYAERQLYKRGFEVCIILRRRGKRLKLSFGHNPMVKTTIKFNCAKIAEEFGGGGHIFASGAIIPMQKKRYALEKIGEYINSLRSC